MMKKLFVALVAFLSVGSASAEWYDGEKRPLKIGENIQYKGEVQGSFADGKTPLWLNANKHGLSSLESTNGYLRGSIIRPLSTDSLRKWGIGYGVDLAVAANYTSTLVVQQAFAELRWLHGALSVGSKEYPMELKNQSLSSGSQTLGINARPVPQVRLSLPDYWRLPFARGWLHIKGHVAYGKMTDDNWQHDFTNMQSKYADNVLYHSKAGYLKIGNEEKFCPWSLELGLEMAATFGGTSYDKDASGQMVATKGRTGLKSLWRAFMPGGSEVVETGTAYENAEGNQLGSWVARLNYDGEYWTFGLYVDKFFEDHSQMFQLDYDGYGIGDEWDVRKKRRYFMYSLKDMMIGMELGYKYRHWLRSLVIEYMYTKYQSGPIYHDHTRGISNHISGIDNYYNHYVYTGWQHWGQVIGNPLYQSPIYNDDGNIIIKDNRFWAFHLGVNGNISEALDYRILATYQKGAGTYAEPFTKPKHNVSVLAEALYKFKHGWNVRAAFGSDMGSLLGHNYGGQLTITKQGLFNL